MVIKRETRIQKYSKSYADIFGEYYDIEKMKVVQPLIDNVAFMAVALEDLQRLIVENGYTETYQNGANQSGIKKSSEFELYNTTIKNFSQLMKQLTDLLPKETAEKIGEKLTMFNAEIERR